MERLPVETQMLVNEVRQHTLASNLNHALNHTVLYPGNQPGNFYTKIPTTEQSCQSKDSCPLGTKEGFIGIVKKLREMEIPGRDKVEHYLRDQYRRNLRLGTIRNALIAIASFLGLVKQSGKNHLEEISRADLAAFIEYEQDRGLKASTVRNRLDTLKAFIRYQIEREVVSADVLFKRMIIKVPDSLPKAMEMDDEEKLLSVIDDVRDRAMILLLLRTGMRIGELLNTQVRDVYLEERKIEIWEAQKNRIGRVVYFSDDAGDALKVWYKKRAPEKAFVFYARGHDTMTYANARAIFCKYIKKADLFHKGYTLHCLRHTNASSLLNAGIPLECLRELLGHNSVEVTRRYARLTSRTREKEYFKAMAKIQRGEIDGYYKLDLELQEILKEKKLLASHGEKLHEQS